MLALLCSNAVIPSFTLNTPTHNPRYKPIMQIPAEVSSRKSIMDEYSDNSVLIQGGSLRTWSYSSPLIKQVQEVISSEGRPVDADI